jgi:hypothetical protein
MHINLLCACWHLEAMKGSSSFTSCRLLILSRLPSSLVWAQLTLLVPALGIRSPLLQDGGPIHRVRTHSLTGIRNIYDEGLVVVAALKREIIGHPACPYLFILIIIFSININNIRVYVQYMNKDISRCVKRLSHKPSIICCNLGLMSYI